LIFDLVYDPVKLSFFICPSLGDQKVEVRMKVYPAFIKILRSTLQSRGYDTVCTDNGMTGVKMTHKDILNDVIERLIQRAREKKTEEE
jgi:hypothetical protein